MSLQYVSPSDFGSSRICPAKSFLNRKSKLKINRSAQSYFGSFCHSFINKSFSLFKGKTLSKNDLKNAWEKEFEDYCNKLLENDEKFYLKHPLKSYISGYIITRTNIISRLLSSRNSKKNQDTFKASSELYIEIDGISGVIDMVYRNDNYVKLVDFKFGKIYDENNQIKDQYQNQLYIYSAMYFKKYGIIPSALALQDNNFKIYNLDPKPMDYCLDLFDDLKKINQTVSNINSEADLQKQTKVNEENCKYCNVKVECSPYWESGIFDSENNLDIFGKIEDIKTGVNGLVLFLKTKHKSDIKVFSVPKNIKRELKKIKSVAFFNLKKKMEKNEFSYHYGKYSDAVFIENEHSYFFKSIQDS